MGFILFVCITIFIIIRASRSYSRPSRPFEIRNVEENRVFHELRQPDSYSYKILNNLLPRRSLGIGTAEEKSVADVLGQLDPNHYKVLNDLLLPSKGNISTTQIDHVVVSNYGIFCIETKSHKGWIFGSANQKNWTQVIFHFRGKMHNPLLQNYCHMKAIKELIGKYVPVVPLVVFTAASRLKISNTDSVGDIRCVMNIIQSYDKPIFSDAQRDEFFATLASSHIFGDNERQLHKQAVKEYMYSL